MMISSHLCVTVCPVFVVANFDAKKQIGLSIIELQFIVMVHFYYELVDIILLLLVG